MSWTEELYKPVFSSARSDEHDGHGATGSSIRHGQLEFTLRENDYCLNTHPGELRKFAGNAQGYHHARNPPPPLPQPEILNETYFPQNYSIPSPPETGAPCTTSNSSTEALKKQCQDSHLCSTPPRTCTG